MSADGTEEKKHLTRKTQNDRARKKRIEQQPTAKRTVDDGDGKKTVPTDRVQSHLKLKISPTALAASPPCTHCQEPAVAGPLLRFHHQAWIVPVLSWRVRCSICGWTKTTSRIQTFIAMFAIDEREGGVWCLSFQLACPATWEHSRHSRDLYLDVPHILS